MRRSCRIKPANSSVPVITLTPLIDTVLVLLVIFMVTTPSKIIIKTTTGKDAVSADLKNRDYRVAHVIVNKQGLVLNGIPKKLQECLACLPEAIKQSPIKTVFIKVEDAQSQMLVYKIIDAARRMGARVVIG